MPLQRAIHWQTRELPTFIESRLNQPFAWGTNDCCMFPADAILAMTGVDVASDFRGNYSSEVSAFALVKSITGGSTVADAAAYCASKHGLSEWNSPLKAQRGDLVVLTDASRLVAGIVGMNGRDVLVPGDSGLQRFSIMSIQRAWQV